MAIKRFTLDFLKTEAGAGFLLAVCALLAILWANSPWANTYFHFIHQPERVAFLGWSRTWPIEEWIKEGLMALFFFMVGMEIKFEVRRGQLSSAKTLALPVIAALGGMIAPALIYVALNLGSHGDLRGWSVPVATDIAFALAVLAMFGKQLPGSLRVFLLTLAIVDDLGAVAIIGIFYSTHFHWLWFAAMFGVLAVMAGAVYVVRSLPWLRWIYLLLFVLVWAFSIEAGLSPSLAAVLAGFCVALEIPGKEASPLQSLAHSLHPYVAYLILPLFAFTASGFSLKGFSLASLGDPRFLGVALGLFIGKQLGVFAAAWGAVRLGFGAMPHRASVLQLYAVCLLCGIGFTMSLFLGALAFPAGDQIAQNAIKSGVIAGSLLSACAGAAILLRARSIRAINE